MAYPSVTYSFSNSTTADATQVNQNFTDIINGLSDGTKDLSVSAITAAGNVTLNANVTLGNASSDTITMTGSVASHVSPSAHNTYDLGTVTTLGWRAFYFASSSATKTAKLQGPAISSDITLTLPTATGTLALVPAYAAKTANYTLTDADDLVAGNVSGGAFTITLPTAAGITGKIYRIKRTDQTLGTSLTVATTSSQTIDGATSTTLETQYEQLTVISDGSNWHILERHIPGVWTSYTATGSFTSNCTYTSKWKRDRDSADFRVEISFSGTPNNPSSLDIDLPSGMTIDTSDLNSSTAYRTIVGEGTLHDSAGGTTRFPLAVFYSTTGKVRVRWLNSNFSSVFYWNNEVTQSSPLSLDANDYIEVKFSVPIANWKG